MAAPSLPMMEICFLFWLYDTNICLWNQLTMGPRCPQRGQHADPCTCHLIQAGTGGGGQSEEEQAAIKDYIQPVRTVNNLSPQLPLFWGGGGECAPPRLSRRTYSTEIYFQLLPPVWPGTSPTPAAPPRVWAAGIVRDALYYEDPLTGPWPKMATVLRSREIQGRLLVTGASSEDGPPFVKAERKTAWGY